MPGPLATWSLDALDVLLRLAAAGLIGAAIGWERRVHHKAVGVAGMVLIAIGSTSYMLLAQRLTATDPSAVGRLLQGFLSGIGFFGGAVIFKSGFDVRGIKAAAAVWITGAVGLAVATSLWGLGIVVGLVTVAVLLVADSFPDPVREERREPGATDPAGVGSAPPAQGISTDRRA